MATNLNTNTALAQIDVTASVKTVTLPSAAANRGRLITIKDKFAAASNYNITVNPLGSDTIDGAATYVLSNAGAALSVVSDGVNRWMTLNSPATPFTGSTISLSSGTIYADSLFLRDIVTSGFSNFTVSSGILKIGSNAVFSGQTHTLSSIALNFRTATGNQANISSITTSNLQANAIGGSTIMGMSFIGDGSQLSNLRLPSSTVLQAQYSFFTALPGSSYSNAPWGSQLLSLSSVAQQVAPMVLSNDGFKLNVFVSTPTVFRVNYMTGGNQDTLNEVRPTITMSVSTATSQVYYPSVENFEGGGGSVSFLERFDSNSQILFYARGLSNYSFTSNDANLYRISFETVSGIGTGIFSTINTWTNVNNFVSTVNFSNALNAYGITTFSGTTNLNGAVTTVDNLVTTTTATFQTLATFQASTIGNAFYASNDIRTIRSTIATSIFTSNLWVMCNATFGPSSITLSNNRISASNVQISTMSILDQSTMTYKVMTISSGSLYLDNTLASAGGGGGGVSSSNVSTLSINSGSLFLGIYFA
jgi:hypothetical protein